MFCAKALNRGSRKAPFDGHEPLSIFAVDLLLLWSNLLVAKLQREEVFFFSTKFKMENVKCKNLEESKC